MKQALSTQSYKGTRDYFPQEKRLQNYIFNVWRTTAEKFGYEEYGAPLLEPIELYTAKSGQELAGEQTYLFEDRGGRVVAIRPEMTPSVSRMVAARRQEIPVPMRLYSIANFMRYERPQRGREREFWQLNADIFGVDGPRADAEIIELAHQSIMAFGATQEMFTVRVNHRQLINQMMTDYLGLGEAQATAMMKLLDKKNKISPDAFTAQATEIFGLAADGGLEKLEKMLEMHTVDDLPEEIKNSPSAAHLQRVMALLAEKGIHNVRFSVTLMRGLDYYTGVVFEVFDEAPENNRALFGGGRYDGLVGLFGAAPIATVGVGMGATTMRQFLEVHHLLPHLSSHTDVYIIPLGEAAQSGADALARELRAAGARAEIDITERKIDKQLKAAVKKQIPFAVFVGEDELKNGVYSLKNLATKEEQATDVSRMITIIMAARGETPEL